MLKIGAYLFIYLFIFLFYFILFYLFFWGGGGGLIIGILRYSTRNLLFPFTILASAYSISYYSAFRFVFSDFLHIKFDKFQVRQEICFTRVLIKKHI